MSQSSKNTQPRLLIIDDQPESIAILLSFLKHQNIDVLVALDGTDGLHKVQLGNPELILLDVSMTGLDGYAVCEQLKANPATAGIPVIFLSASNSVDDKLKGFAAGAADYVTKPFSPDEILARISVHLRAKRTLERLESAARQRVVQETRPGQADEKLYARALAALEDDVANPPSVESLAHMLGCNVRKITALFRKHTGMSVADYCFELRMESSRRLLYGSDMQIQLIADQAGYKNAGDFTRAFLRRYGMTPRQFRQGKQAA